MNKAVRAIYEEYRDEMAQTLALEDVDPVRLSDPQYFNQFARRVEKLDTLIELYASLLSANRN